MPRPGFVLDVDRSTPPILFHHGEGFRLERLPAGRSRVDLPGRAARRRSTTPTPPSATRCCNPLDSEPLPALLRPGMKLTIAFDDISLPLPPMRRPDIRQRVIEAVLDLAAAAGVDDVHLIAALALHRRMTEAELRHAVGDRVYDAFAPDGCSTTTTPRTPTTWRSSGRTDQGEEVEINKRAAESDLLVYVNINLVAMDGGWKSHRHRAWPATAASATTTTCETMQHSRSRSWTGTSRELHYVELAHGQGHHATPASRSSRSRRRSTTTRSARRADVASAEARVGVDGPRPGHVHRPCRPGSNARRARKRRRQIFQLAGALRHHLGAGRRGRGRARADHRERLRAAPRPGRGPDRHPHDGPALHLPLQRRTRS